MKFYDDTTTFFDILGWGGRSSGGEGGRGRGEWHWDTISSSLKKTSHNKLSWQYPKCWQPHASTSQTHKTTACICASLIFVCHFVKLCYSNKMQILIGWKWTVHVFQSFTCQIKVCQHRKVGSKSVSIETVCQVVTFTPYYTNLSCYVKATSHFDTLIIDGSKY